MPLRPQRWSLRARLVLSLGVMLALMLVMGGAGIAALQRAAGSATALRLEARHELTVLWHLGDAVSQAEGLAVRRAHAPEDETVRRALAAQTARIEADLAALARFDEPAERRLAVKGREAWRRARTALEASIEARAGQPGPPPPAVARESRAARELAAALVAQGLEELQADATAIERRKDQMVLFLAAMAALAIGLAAALARRLERAVTEPLAALRGSARRFGDGKFRERVQLARDDELGQVGRAFNAMAERLEGSRRQLTQQVFHDPLTGLANRKLFALRTQRALAQSAGRRGEGPSPAVLFCDLDDFKAINDSFGHGAGDELLVAVARRLERCVRPGDAVARLGGDEFAILLETVQAPDEAEAIARRALEELSVPFAVAGRELDAGASIGIAVAQAEDTSSEELLRNADVAMYSAKDGGKHATRLFEPHMQEQVRERLELEGELRRALARGELELHFQPILELASEQVTGLEALLRWNHARRGLLQPADFVGVAERTGLIVPIGRWVLREACREAAARQPAEPGRRLTMSVNLSPRQFEDPGLVDDVLDVLTETGLDPACLVLEITESLLALDVQSTLGKLSAIKRLGVRLAVDDFGTGYSSLSYLRDFEVDILKIDKSFVHAMGSGRADELARAIIGLGQALDLRTVAEGVEGPEQEAVLRSLGCDLAQGFLWARPVPAHELAGLLDGSPLVRQPAQATLAAPTARPPAPVR